MQQTEIAPQRRAPARPDRGAPPTPVDQPQSAQNAPQSASGPFSDARCTAEFIGGLAEAATAALADSDAEGAASLLRLIVQQAAAIVATAVGYAMEGGRAVVELMYGDFIGRAGDEIFNQMAKWQAMSAGALKVPVVLRASAGSKYGAQHSQDWTGLIAHMPGLKLLYPATPYDAKGLLASALSSEDPVVFFESQRQ